MKNVLHHIIRHHGSRLFGISKTEAVRVFYAFCIKCIFQISFLAGGTLLTALYVGLFSLESLPLFLMVQSLLVMGGTWGLAGFLRRFAPSSMIIFGSFAASTFLILSVVFLEYPFVFIGLMSVAMCVFMAQVNIWISLFIENLFSPMEGEHVFPVIESSEPIGGIIAGIITVGLVSMIGAQHMVLVVGVLLLFLPLLLLFSLKTLESIPVLKVRREHRNYNRVSRNMFVSAFYFFQRNTFITLLFVVTFLLSSMAYFLEYQFTQVVDKHIQNEDIVVYGPQLHNSYDYVNALMHSFGSLQIIIFGVLFFVQLLFTSRILQKIGVMRTFALFPLISLFSFAAMFFHFSYATVAIAKGVFKIGKGIGKSALLSSFYALQEDVRNDAKEVLDGVAKPFGLFFGTLSLFLIESTFSPEKATSFSAVFLVITSAMSFFLLLRARHLYTHINHKKLNTRINLPEKVEAIEILGQPGHTRSTETLIHILMDKNEIPEVREKVLQVLGHMKRQKAIPALLHCFKDPHPRVQLAAVTALQHFDNLGKRFFSQAFSVYSMQAALKTLFLQTHSTDVKVAVIKVFANLKDAGIIGFLVKALSSKNPEVRAESALVCGMFHDSGTIFHVKHLLSDTHPTVRAAAISALWQFHDIRKDMLQPVLDDMFRSSDEETIIAGIRAAGWTKNVQKKQELLTFLHSKNHRIRRHAAIALVQMKEKKAHKPLLQYLFHEEKEIGKKTKKMLEQLDDSVKSDIHKMTMREALNRISSLLKKAKTSVLENLQREELHELLHLFHLINAEREIWKIRMILRERGEEVPAYA